MTISERDFEKCRQTKNINSQFCAFLQTGKVQGHHQIFSFTTLVKYFYCTKTVFVAFFIGLLIQQGAV